MYILLFLLSRMEFLIITYSRRVGFKYVWNKLRKLFLINVKEKKKRKVGYLYIV